MAADGEFDVDKIIANLHAWRTAPSGKPPEQLTENDFNNLCALSQPIFLEQPSLLELNPPLKVAGDVHGQFYDFLRLLDLGGVPPQTNYLFLGDYVDRGRFSLETIGLMMAYKIKYPENFFLLRGNHECANINRVYGFFDECKRRFTIKLWRTFCDCFNCLPLAAIIEDRIFCCHGGLSPHLTDMDQIRRIKRPTTVPPRGVICDLLWSDPDRKVPEWADSERGVSYLFSASVVRSFLQAQNLDLVVRAHQVVADGYEFFASRQLVTIFSAPNYCGVFNNNAALMVVDQNLKCSFQILRPVNQSQFIRAAAKTNLV